MLYAWIDRQSVEAVLLFAFYLLSGGAGRYTQRDRGERETQTGKKMTMKELFGDTLTTMTGI